MTLIFIYKFPTITILIPRNSITVSPEREKLSYICDSIHSSKVKGM